MATRSPKEITRLLLAWRNGNQEALESLTPLVYGELRRLARRHMRGERVNHTLQTTALVHEAYLKLIDSSQVQWQDRAHFFAVASQLMRRILVDFARSRKNLKRGGDAIQISFSAALEISQKPDADLMTLDDALNSLARLDPRQSRVVELRFFGGLSVEETAEALKVSPETVKRDWRLAKVWLLRELGRGGGGHDT
jgi:RNA polymerase sigma factor (TIGR02999 family)